MSWPFLIPLILQIGPWPGGSTVSALPQEMRDREALEQQKQAAEASGQELNLRQQCLQLARTSPVAGQQQAESWLAIATGTQKAEAGHCLGFALSQQGQWSAAERAFSAARIEADPMDRPYRARLAAMAGNAALADGDAAGALILFNAAEADARSGGDASQLADIATDRARALVVAGRIDEATQSLATARATDPANARTWLLSATLSRRTERLGDAQQQIEQAARLDPANPEVGLEAGVIAVLTGRDDAARKSWQSVIAIAPDSAEASVARDYIAQLDGAQ
ncbi:MAG: hypothetical protein R3E18_08410 [Sphingomonadaceae bacterium]|nr:hypothetical protein [Sphingomonadaceae bacterium]